MACNSNRAPPFISEIVTSIFYTNLFIELIKDAAFIPVTRYKSGIKEAVVYIPTISNSLVNLD